MLFVLATFVFGWSVLGFYQKSRETKENKQLAAATVAGLKAEKGRLSDDIARLETKEGIEENIREKFGLAKEGEGLIVIMDESLSGETNTKEDPEKGFWNFIKNLFK